MVDDEQPTNDDAEPVIPEGPRRSTFTPPPSGAAYDPTATDDDALAGALTEQFERWAPPTSSPSPTSPSPTSTSPTSTSPVVDAEPLAPEREAPASAAPAQSYADPSPFGAAEWQPAAWEPAPSQPAPAESAPWQTAPSEQAPWQPAPSEQAPWQPTVDQPPVVPSATVYDLSMTNSASSAPPFPTAGSTPVMPQAAPVNDSPSVVPPPPQRLSLTDEELLAAANLDSPEHDTSSLLDLVERELVLRQIEAQRLAEWEKQVRAVAAPEADDIVTQVREQFTGVTPVISPPIEVPNPSAGLSVAEQLAAAPPPQFGAPQPAPVIDLALADAPPPLGVVPSAAVAPPLSVPAPFEESAPLTFETAPPAVAPLIEPPLIEPAPRDPAAYAPSYGDTAAASAASGIAGSLFDDLLREPAPADSTNLGDPASAAVGVFDVTSGFATNNDAEPSSLDLFAGQFADESAVAPLGGEAAPDGVIDDEADMAPRQSRPPRVERVALEPTPAELRAGRSVRLFWLWFAVNSSVVSIALGSVIMGLGVSLRQAVLATLIGVALSFLPLGLGTLAGKWSGQPTMVVSRSTFGTAGNAIPALLALITRLVWAAALLWMLGVGVAEVLVSSSLVGDLGRLELTIGAASIALVIAALIAGFGFALISVISAIVTIVSIVLVTGLIVLTASYVDLDEALAIADGDWALLVSGAVLVFSVVGLAWANSSGDLARYQAKGTYGSSAVLFTAFGATIPAFVVICWGALLAASNPVLAEGLAENPIDLVSRMLPLWYPAPLVAAVALSLVSAAALALYSSGFALLATGVRASRPASVAITTVLAAALVAVLVVLVPDAASLFRDVVTTLAVPVAAWAGIFGAETMIRSRRVHSPSLLRSGGVYPAVRWVNLLMFLVITAVGWGLSTATLVGLQWQGYLFTLLSIDTETALASSDPGVVVALILGLLTPIIMGIPALRRLQRAEQAANDADAAGRADDRGDDSDDTFTDELDPTVTTTPGVVTEFDLATWSPPSTQ